MNNITFIHNIQYITFPHNPECRIEVVLKMDGCTTYITFLNPNKICIFFIFFALYVLLLLWKFLQCRINKGIVFFSILFNAAFRGRLFLYQSQQTFAFSLPFSRDRKQAVSPLPWRLLPPASVFFRRVVRGRCGHFIDLFFHCWTAFVWTNHLKRGDGGGANRPPPTLH